MTQLPVPEPGRDAAEDFVARHLSHLATAPIAGSLRFSGGQSAADLALKSFDVAGYAERRNEVFPQPRRGASGLSPYIRHGLLTLTDVWRHVAGGPGRDVAKFRDELMWQEYARHWYARLGPASGQGVRHRLEAKGEDGWNRELACLELTLDELEEDGWLVNQTRMWLASHWTVRQRRSWEDGEDYFFRHLLDGSRAANRLGWQWTTGVGSSKAYGFSRWQVEKRAPGLCATCDLVRNCPIENWPPDPPLEPIDPPRALTDPLAADRLVGPVTTESRAQPAAVWLTAESLGFRDPALVAHPTLPVVFVFDEPLLARLRLDSKRLVFLTETLAELGQQRDLEIHLDDPALLLTQHPVAVTHAPVPGFVRRAETIEPAVVHPWPWLAWPSGGPVDSFSTWRRSAEIVS